MFLKNISSLKFLDFNKFKISISGSCWSAIIKQLRGSNSARLIEIFAKAISRAASKNFLNKKSKSKWL